MNEKHFVGLDCGNSSFRTLIGTFDGSSIKTEVVDQTMNEMVQVGDYFYWNILKIFAGFKKSLKKIVKNGVHIDSIGVCTWGVDFALFGKSGAMLSNPLSYRNQQGAQYLDKLNDNEKSELFNELGIVCDKINSVYLLQAIRDNMPEIYNASEKVLMVPDILNYFLTGVKQNEPSELSTTQLVDSRTRQISEFATNFFDISSEKFCEIGTHGKVIGYLLDSIKEEIGVDYDIPIICVPSHDTASAVAAIPNKEEDYIFISSGTWALIGTEIDEPIINDEVCKSSLTNEVGAFGKITLLKNNAGMFIIQEIKKEYDWAIGRESSWKELDEMTEKGSGKFGLIDVNSVRLFNPKSMSDEVWAMLSETNQVTSEKNWEMIFNSVYYSMACCYGVVISDIEKITGKSYERIYIVGGGSKNILLNKLTSICTGKEVVACSKESTALGNIAVQIFGNDEKISVQDVNKILENSIKLKTYKENETRFELVEKYRKII